MGYGTGPYSPRDSDYLYRAGFSFEEIVSASALAEQHGVTASDIFLASGAADEATLYRALAEELGAPFTLSPPRINSKSQFDLAFKYGIASLEPGTNARFIAAPSGKVLKQFLLARRLPVSSGFIVTTPSAFHHGLLAVSLPIVMEAATIGLSRDNPKASVRSGFSRYERIMLLFLLLALIGWGWFAPIGLMTSIGLVVGTLFLMRTIMWLAALAHTLPSEAMAAPRIWPDYTVLVALHDEEKSVPALVKALKTLDYPQAKLEILFLLEAHDSATRSALEREELAPSMRMVVLPDGPARTKGRALNVGLMLARGDYIAVYDAEDAPDPQQLRKAAARFAQLPRHVGALQARLSIYNSKETPISRFFALEYATLFDVILPGLAGESLPLTLGGTSNHFRTQALRTVGGWDAWNVTEDADLGLRLARYGYGVEMLNSVTGEEAPISVMAWLRQRIRWMKGWMQTSLVMMRAPRVAIARMGLLRWSAALALSHGTVLTALAGPWYMIMAGIAFFGEGLDQALASLVGFGITTFAVSVFSLGLCGMILPLLLAIWRRRMWGMLPWLPFLPIYLLLMSLAAWLAVYELLVHPQKWNKTPHGVTQIARSVT
jgi:glycosyltransferase XagB